MMVNEYEISETHTNFKDERKAIHTTLKLLGIFSSNLSLLLSILLAIFFFSFPIYNID